MPSGPPAKPRPGSLTSVHSLPVLGRAASRECGAPKMEAPLLLASWNPESDGTFRPQVLKKTGPEVSPGPPWSRPALPAEVGVRQERAGPCSIRLATGHRRGPPGFNMLDFHS